MPRPPAADLRISIHALREEGDLCHLIIDCIVSLISIHALREEGDWKALCWSRPILISIHALREEGDERASRPRCGCLNFYPRPPRGGRPEQQHKASTRKKISIHALREEGDVAHD